MSKTWDVESWMRPASNRVFAGYPRVDEASASNLHALGWNEGQRKLWEWLDGRCSGHGDIEVKTSWPSQLRRRRIDCDQCVVQLREAMEES